MRWLLLAFALGVIALQQQPVLPSSAYALYALIPLVLAPALVRCARARYRRAAGIASHGLLAIGVAVLAFFYAGWRAEIRLADALPPVWEGRDIRVVGVVDELPQPAERGIRFAFAIERTLTPSAIVPSRVSLAWYADRDRSDEAKSLPRVHAGERWDLVMRLKRPHGSVNPHGFDVEAWLLENELRATGYVRAEESNRRVDAFAGRMTDYVARARESIRDRILEALGDRPYAGVIAALAIGDERAIPNEQWQLFNHPWNRRLIAIEGAGCPGGWYFQGTAGGSLSIPGIGDFSLFSPARLGEGYALFGNTLQNASQNCNAVLESESALMSKEHFIETYGPPVYTVTEGCSGGSYGSIQPADLLPGLFDGALIACTFPDPLGIAFSGSDGHLLTHYFTFVNPSAFTAAEQVAVSGYKGTQAWIDAANQSGRTDPVPNRVDIPGYSSAAWSPVVPVSLRYDPVSNPHGARPTIYDHARNIYGIDPSTGFALRPFDNVGVQYGLQALNAGTITPEQFVTLNEGIGGYDQDFNYVSNRVVGDLRAIKRAQLGGLQLGANGGLASIPVFDISGLYNDDAGYHYQWFHFATRERMLQANGSTANHVMWRGNPVPFDTAWSLFIHWVEAVAADPSSLSQREKVINDKPAAGVDGCWSDPNTFIAEPQVFGRAPTTQCNTLFPSYAFPRYVAGGPLAANVMKCALKPLDLSEYAVSFTSDQLTRLHDLFRNGVCDWSRPNVNHVGVLPYVSFGPAPENLVFDITK